MKYNQSLKTYKIQYMHILEVGAIFFEFSLSIAYYYASINMMPSAIAKFFDVDIKEHLSGSIFCTHK